MQRVMLNDSQIEKVYSGAIRVLGEMGMKVENHTCLEAMERLGCRIDYPGERAIIAKDVLDRVLDMVRTDGHSLRERATDMSSDIATAAGGTCPLYLDDDTGQRRRATEEDCIFALKIADTSVPAVSPPVSDCGVPAKYEAIRVLELGIRTVGKATLCGTDLFFPEQVQFAVELGLLYKNDPAYFLPAGNCPSSPLTVGKTIADLAVAKARYDKVYAVPTMPVMGANAPITCLGAAVIGIAEILGGYVLAKALNPETRVSASALSSLMDMRSGSMTYIAPEVFMADIAMCEVMERHLGLPCSAFGRYIDAKLPGMRAVHEKMLRSVALGLYAPALAPDGSLDQGKVFSPTQMTLDIELARFVGTFVGGPNDDDDIGVDAILDIAWDSTGYLMHEHTIGHMRQVSEARVFGRDGWISAEVEREREDKHLENARQVWRDNLAKYQPPDHSDDFLRELDKISASAKETLA